MDPLEKAYAELKQAILDAQKKGAKRHFNKRDAEKPKVYRVVSREPEQIVER